MNLIESVSEGFPSYFFNKIQKWSTENGFKFSKSKTVCMHFCHLRKAHNDPILTLDGTPIPVVEENKFLGVIFDRKLSFIPHTKQLKAKCQKAFDYYELLPILTEERIAKFY